MATVSANVHLQADDRLARFQSVNGSAWVNLAGGPDSPGVFCSTSDQADALAGAFAEYAAHLRECEQHP
jgi:hypothetical protein